MDEQNDKNENNQTNPDDINKMTMDNMGNIRADKNGTVALTENTRLFTILGWISTALAAFVSPVFAIAGIVFGVLLNRKIKGRGNMIIIASVVLSVAKFILGYIFLSMVK